MTQALRVLVYSKDRQVLAHLWRLLAACGHEVRQAGDDPAMVGELEAFAPHVLLVDLEPGLPELLDVCRAASSGHSSGKPYIMVLGRGRLSEAIRPAWEAGADDFLQRPVVYGELLARLRFAARALEFERRIARLPGIDPLTGLPNRAAFIRRMRARLLEVTQQQPAPDVGTPARKAVPVPSPAALPLWVAMADLDRLSAINRRQGWPTGDTVLQQLAEALVHQAGQHATVGSFGAGRFAILVECDGSEKARAWAENVRTALAASQGPGQTDSSGVSGTRAGGPVTVSIGLAPCQPGLAPEDVIVQAEQALAAAKSTGRNTACVYGEVLGPPKGWTDFAAGRLFAHTRAADVMTVVTRVVQADAPASEAWSLLRRLATAALPVVQPNGKLVGLILAEHAPPTPHAWEGATAGQVAERDVPLEDEGASFERLREFFTRDSRPAIVIQRAGKPVGLVTADCLAALGVPVSPETFAMPGAESTAALAVPDLRPLAAP